MSPLDKTIKFRESVETKSQLAFIKEVFERKLPVCLWGGYADDALLHGTVSRSHQDVDMAAYRTDSELLKQEFAKMGLQVEEVAFAKGEKPYKLLVTDQHMRADISLFDTDDKGLPIMDIFYSKTKERFKIDFDPEVFHTTHGTLEGMTITTVSPLALIRSKDAYFQAGTGASRKKDVASKKALLARFFPEDDPNADKFKLRIQKI